MEEEERAEVSGVAEKWSDEPVSKILFDREFRPGSIHQQEFRDFWVKELKASRWVLDALDQGYTIPFTEEPGQYEEKNNASALRNMQIVREQVRKGKVFRSWNHTLNKVFPGG